MPHPSDPLMEFICDAIPLDLATYENSDMALEHYNHDEGYRTAMLVIAARAEELGLPQESILMLMRGAIAHLDAQPRE